jgi:hypothetical protein
MFFCLGFINFTSNLKMIDCIFCGKELEMNEIFLAHAKKDDSITHFQCMRCAKNNPDGRLDKNGGAWYPVQQTLDGVVVYNKHKEICGFVAYQKSKK